MKIVIVFEARGSRLKAPGSRLKARGAVLSVLLVLLELSALTVLIEPAEPPEELLNAKLPKNASIEIAKIIKLLIEINQRYP
ncbi:MAG: hypothetical protein K2J82_10615 [Muribaculaceae bacterium]|nr:hypothetical protein [Muribaculaceae bacterium]